MNSSRARPIVFAVALGIIVIGLSTALIVDFLNPIGPADFKVQWFTYSQLDQKYGQAIRGRAVKIESFTRDSNDEAGTYKISYRHDGHHGYVYCRYDPKAGTFSVSKFDEQ